MHSLLRTSADRGQTDDRPRVKKMKKIGKIFCQFKNLSYLCKVFGPQKGRSKTDIEIIAIDEVVQEQLKL